MLSQMLGIQKSCLHLKTNCHVKCDKTSQLCVMENVQSRIIIYSRNLTLNKDLIFVCSCGYQKKKKKLQPLWKGIFGNIFQFLNVHVISSVKN